MKILNIIKYFIINIYKFLFLILKTDFAYILITITKICFRKFAIKKVFKNKNKYSKNDPDTILNQKK